MEDLDALWRRAQLWPESAMGIFSYLARSPIEIGAREVLMPWQIKERFVLPEGAEPETVLDPRRAFGGGAEAKPQADAIAKGLEQLCAETTVQAAGGAYEQLAQRDLYTVARRSVIDRLAEPPVDRAVLASFLLFIVRQSPHLVAIENATYLLQATEGPIDAELVDVLGRHPRLAGTLLALIDRWDVVDADREQLLFTLAKSATDFDRVRATALFSRKSDPEIKAWMVRSAVFGLPGGYPIEDVPTPFDLARKGDLRSALEADDPDPELLIGATEICERIAEKVVWSAPGENEEESHALFLLLDHLRGRRITLAQMWSLHWIDHVIHDWSYGDISLTEDDVFDSDEWAWSREDFRRASEAIHQIVAHDANVAQIESALADPLGRGFDNAVDVAVHFRGADEFELRFLSLALGSPGALDRVAQVVQDKSHAQRLVDWGMAHLGIDVDGNNDAGDPVHSAPGDTVQPGPMLGGIHALTDAEAQSESVQVLSRLLKASEKYPEVGGPLILAGLRSGHYLPRYFAAQTLLGWELSDWPPAAWALVAHCLEQETNEKALEKLRAARDKHSASPRQ